MSILKEPVAKNVTEVKKVKNVSNKTPFIFNGKYVILPGQVDLIEDKDWIGKGIWKDYLHCNENGSQVRLLECHHRNETVTEDNEKTLKYAINEYLSSQATTITTTVDGVHYSGKVINKGSNSLIFFKETVITPKPVTAVDINQTAPTVAVGATTTLTATVTPTDATDSTLVWESEKPAKATVNPTTGVVTGVATGKTNIYAISVESGVHDVVEVTVTEGQGG